MFSPERFVPVRLLYIFIFGCILTSGCDALSSGSDDSPVWTGDWWKSGVGLQITEEEFVSVLPRTDGQCDINKHIIEEASENTITVRDGLDDGDGFLNLESKSKEIEFEVSENAGAYQDNNRDVITLRVSYESLNEQVLTFFEIQIGLERGIRL
jgi:hypothetical protein